MRTVTEVRAARAGSSGTVGLVPTMGYLHEGHLSLVRRARLENDVCAAWIFVNPTQFGPRDDFQRYPRDEDRDVHLLAQEGVDLLFMPSVEEIYPPGFGTYVMVEQVTDPLEGAARPGHFRGVATVVCKFLHILEPHRVYFGQKDAQQVVVLRKMLRDLNFRVEMVTCPTVRDSDGLALSSRNAYLSAVERRAAQVLYRTLVQAAELWHTGSRDTTAIRAAMRTVLAEEPLVSVEYVSIADPETLNELTGEAKGAALASLAVHIRSTRLIDNMVLL